MISCCKKHKPHTHRKRNLIPKEISKTLGLRNRFAREMGKRFRKIRGLIKRAVSHEDVFGLKNIRLIAPELRIQTPGRRAFVFETNEEKARKFMEWLEREVNREVLGVTFGPPPEGSDVRTGIEEKWTGRYIHSAYQRGISDARARMRQQGLDIPEFRGITKKGEYIGTAFNQPFHADRLGYLYSRTFSSLKGVTQEMDTAISQVLAQGLADGLNPMKLAKQLNAVIADSALEMTDKLGRFIPAERRARMLARTEIIRAHVQANLMEYKQAGVKKVKYVFGGVNSCPKCEADNGRIYDLKAIWDKIPQHPHCGCGWVPVIDVKALQDEVERLREEAEELERRHRKLMNSADKLKPCMKLRPKFNVEIYKPQMCGDYYRQGNKWYYQGQEVTGDEAKRLKAMGLPPGWRDVVVARNRGDKIQAVGLDKAGRWQYRYSDEHIQAAARKKFDRVKSFAEDMPRIRGAYRNGMIDEDMRAMLLYLEDLTAIRVGSDADFKAKVKAYGLTTLLNKHVTIDGNNIILKFVAKEGIEQTYKLTDSTLADYIRRLKSGKKAGDQLFPEVNASKLNKYLKEISGNKNYSIKDFRTYHATELAFNELQKYKGRSLTKKQKKKVIDDVSKIVSDFLHNTPGMARKSYIDPFVWEIIGGLD